MGSTARTAQIARGLGIAAVVAMAAGPALAQLEVGTPFVDFRIFGLGILLGTLALIFGAIGLAQTRPSTGRGGRASAVTGIVLGLVPVGIVAASLSASGGAPMINDITTNLDDPPSFQTAQTLEANAGRDLAYPGAPFAEQQRAGYPDLMPIRVAGSPESVYARCVTAAEGLGWSLTAHDPERGTFEAIDVSSLFRFVDDIVVRVRAGGDAAVVDIRSKSRDGKSDMGANAARIRAFRDALGS